MMKYNKNQKKRPTPHGLFWEWPMAHRGGYHMFRICLYDLDTLPDSISSTLDIVWLLCNTSKCVKNAVFRKKTPPSEIQKHHNSSIYLKWLQTYQRVHIWCVVKNYNLKYPAPYYISWRNNGSNCWRYMLGCVIKTVSPDKDHDHHERPIQPIT